MKFHFQLLKLKLIDGKIREAESILVENLDKATNFGLIIQEKLIKKELQRITTQKEEWKKLLQNDIDASEKLKLVDLKSYITEVKNLLR